MLKKEVKPIKRSKAEARKFYNRISSFYDLFIGKFEKKYRQRGIELLKINEGDKVLEIGYGTGESILQFAEKVGKTGKVYGVDLSPKMYQLTVEKIKKAGYQDRVELFCRDAVEFKHESHDLTKIFLSFTLELFSREEIRKILDNCWQILHSEGEIGIVSLSRKDNNLLVKLYEKLHEKFPVAIDCRPIYVRESLKEASFEIKTQERLSMWGLPVDIVVGKK